MGTFNDVSINLVRDFVDANFIIAFDRNDAPSMAPAFVTSFCTHSADNYYVHENGLLSQWRGYSAHAEAGRFAIVFDSKGIDDLLAKECKDFRYSTIQFGEVSYLDERVSIENDFPDLIKNFEKACVNRLNQDSIKDVDLFSPFFKAAVLLKHQAFFEEREVRIVAVPMTQEFVDHYGSENNSTSDFRSLKRIRKNGSKSYIALFETSNSSLPISRIIVGPSKNQDDDFDFVRKLAPSGVKIVKSRTPYLG